MAEQAKESRSFVKTKAASLSNARKLAKMAKEPRPPQKLTPSSFMSAMSLSTQERLQATKEVYPPKIIELLDIGATTTNKDFSVDIDQALFQPFPSELVFQQLIPNTSYEIILTLKNLDRVARHVKVTEKDSPYFTVTSSKPVGQKVAPGMEATYIVQFTPTEDKDYHHELVFVTERERFVVPVTGYGSRGVLDFPDDIHFSSSPVKHKSCKTILVRNVGKKEANFKLETNKPFSVSPSHSSLPVNSCTQANVQFQPTRTGDYTGELTIQYDTGEVVYVQLHGTAVDVNVRLDKGSILMENTYIGLCSQRTLTLHNRTDIVAHFEWKLKMTAEDEELHREIINQELSDEEASSKRSLLDRCVHNPYLRDRVSILDHNFDKRKTLINNERFLFLDDVFSIDPVEGEVWPHSQIDVTISFQPEKALNYSSVAFCDVTGRESRLPLRLKGEGLGPKLRFSFDSLNIENIFVNSAHAYEVVLENQGDIEASYCMRSSSSLFGPKFIFNPSSGHLSPDGLQAIQISFSSTTLGSFDEEFEWDVDGSNETLKLRIIGCVIGPTFQFDVDEINFDVVSYGFPSVRQVSLTNTSEVPMTYSLRVPAHGGKVDEFVINPDRGILPPSLHQNIIITFTPTEVKKYTRFLVLDVDEAGKDVFSLPIQAHCVVPEVILHTSSLHYGRCFVTHPYTLNVHLENTSETLPVKYKMIEQESDAVIECMTTKPEGIIEALETLTLPFTIEARGVGPLVSTASFMIAGSTDPPLQLRLHCTGEGPVVSVSQEHLDWGLSPVLTPINKSLVLCNQSEIDAEFQAFLMKEGSVFTVYPFTGIVPARKKLSLSVTAELDDCIQFTDKLTITIIGGISYTISLSAEGKGTTIVSSPSMLSSVNMGTHFACSQVRKQFTLTNRGRRSQTISWTTEGFSMAKWKKAEIERISRDHSDVGETLKVDGMPKRPMFQISPDQAVLLPYQSQTVVITAYSDIAQEVKERLLCHAIIGRNPHKERIMTVDIVCLFIAPLLEFSTKEVTFRMEQEPESQLEKHVQDTLLKNVSPLPLTALFSCSYPFRISLSDDTPFTAKQTVSLLSGDEASLLVQYDSSYCVDKQSRRENQQIEISYKEHPQKDYINLLAEIHFPNIHFASSRVDFGCVLNNTEVTKVVRMANNSPLVVNYRWYFLKGLPERRDPLHDDEGVDMQSECETDSIEGSSSSLGLQQQPVEDDEGGGAEGGVTTSSIKVVDVEESPLPSEKGEKEEEGEGGGKRGSIGFELREAPEFLAAEKILVQITAPSLTSSQLEENNKTSREDDASIVMSVKGPPEEYEVPHAVSQSLPPSEPSEATIETEEEEEEEEEMEGEEEEGRERQPWEMVGDPLKPVSIRQIFDILPLFGVLQPGETQDVEMTFFGHTDVATEVRAICKVEGGPAYELVLAGEASDIQYKINKKKIRLGIVPYDSLCCEEVTLSNVGKVALDFEVLGAVDGSQLEPGQFSVSPAQGCVEHLEVQTIKVKFFPGIPQVFQKSIEIKVAHFEPDTITLTGEASYPRLSFSISRPAIAPEESSYKEAMLSLKKRHRPKVRAPYAITDEDIEKEVESLYIEQFVKEHKLICSNGAKSCKIKPVLPEYHLDFGYVVYGLIASQTVCLTNPGPFPLTFSPSHSAIRNTGFCVNLDKRIKGLPPDSMVEFDVIFDPAAVQCQQGRVETTLPFQLLGGPIYPLRLTAQVTLPMMEISLQDLDFGTVLCGQCRIITLRLYNPLKVKCEWNAILEKPPKKIPKHTPLHIKKKMKEKPPPQFFEVEPTAGILLPEQKMDIQVRFMPCEEQVYTDKIPISIHQNPEANLVLNMEGRGSEPRLVFDKRLVEFTPILPFASYGSELEVTVTNPMEYPIEFYSVEFDSQYLLEEEALRWVKGYDRRNRLYLPPVELGKGLPYEIMEAHKKETAYQNKPLLITDSPPDVSGGINPDESILSVAEGHTQLLGDLLNPAKLAELRSPMPSSTALLPQTVSTAVLSNATVGSLYSDQQLEGYDASPVAACIARYLGIDISPEAAIAEMRRGIAIVIYGPPYSGKTTHSRKLGGVYDIPVITIDGLLIDAISTASTPAGCKARELLMESTKEAKEVEASEQAVIDTPLASKANISTQRRASRLLTSAREAQLEPKREPPKVFKVAPLLETEFAVPDETLYVSQLPEDIVLEVLSDRLLHPDCRRGVVFDGLQSIFTADQLLSTALILKAFQNRKHIFFVNLDLDLEGVKVRIEEMEKERQRLIDEEIKQKRLEKERIDALLDMSEDEYEALPAHKRKEIDSIRHQRYMEKRRKRAEEERKERERIEREKREEAQRLEEEKAKGKKGGRHLQQQQQAQQQATQPKPSPGDFTKPSPAHIAASRPESAISTHPQHPLGMQAAMASTASIVSSTTDSQQGKKKKGHSKEHSKDDDDHKDEDLKKRFSLYETSKLSIKNLLDNWDRSKGVVRPKRVPPPINLEPEPSKVTTPKRKMRKSGVGTRQETASVLSAQPTGLEAIVPIIEDDDENREGVGIPIIHFSSTRKVEEVHQSVKEVVPSLNEILKGLGLGPEGNPIPDPVSFQVYHYPVKRKPVQRTLQEHFLFIEHQESSDINLVQEETSKLSLEEDSRAGSPDLASSRKRSGGKSKEDLQQRRPSLKSRPTKASTPSPQFEDNLTMSDDAIEHHRNIVRLEKYRWIIPPKSDQKLKLLFISQEEGQYDQTLKFEIFGTRRQYQLFCRGTCQLPIISREPRVVFPHRKRTIKKGEIVSKKYILDKDEFYFGPLHCGKPRERYREGRYPENMETINISNSSGMEVNVSFCFKNDVTAATFLLEPPKMILQSGESKLLTVWAYPKGSGEFRDELVCSIVNNPRPVTFTMCCHGVEPELKIDKRLLEFGRVLLHRRESRVLHLRNNTLLAAAWKLSGTETLGDEFTFSQEQGIVQPKSEFPLTVHFRAVKPAVSTTGNKKAFKIEISDVAQIIGLMHVENVILQAEAYDVALDISFPKGTDGGLDFGCLRVHEELRLTMQVKNRGRYDIAYNFSFDANPDGPLYSKWLIVHPVNSILVPGEKSQTVSVTFKPDRELAISDHPILKCQVIDTHLGDHGEVIANIPIRISAKAVYSKYSVTPTSDVNFGCIVIAGRKSNSFTIENKGSFEFKYAVTKKLPLDVQKMRQAVVPGANAPKRAKGDLSSASRSSSIASKLNVSMRGKDGGSMRYEIMGGGTQRLVVGMFTVAPATGMVGPGQSQTITVDCIAEKPGKHDELLSIEISDSNRKDMPMLYKLCGEVMIPSINNNDIGAIFEEHRICKELGILGVHQFHEEGCIGVYGEKEKRFVFKSVIVGSTSKARIKIINPNKISCDVLINTKSPSTSSSKQKSVIEAFEVFPTKASIPSHSHIYAVVTFRPITMQTYNAIFEALVEGPSLARGKGLSFELQGEGNLPQVAILHPKTRSTQGEYMMLFKNLFIGEREILPIILQNIGNIPATLNMTLSDHEVFTIFEPVEDMDDTEVLYCPTASSSHSASPLVLDLPVGSTKEVRAAFSPTSVEQYRSTIQLNIKDNQFEAMSVVLVGEGYQSDVVIGNVKRRASERFIECEQVIDSTEANRESNLNYGVSPVGEPAHLSFTLSNLSTTDAIRFQWPVVPCLAFSPAIGHIHPSSSREITAAFTCIKPKKFQGQRFAGKYWKIAYSKPISQVPEWDDLMKTVKYINAPSESRPSSSKSKPDEEGVDSGKPPMKSRVVETEPEPEHKVIDKNGEDLELFLTGEAAYAKYDCPSRLIDFRDTYVLQTKVFSFPLKNTGRVVLSYKWYLMKEIEGTEQPLLKDASKEDEMEEILIQIEPTKGEIPPGQEQLITVKYSPIEIGSILYKLHCKIQHLESSAKPLDVIVQGNSLVPYCHFDLPESDYLRARRPTNVSDSAGCVTGRIDQSSKVIEFIAKGTGVRIIRSFDVVNPTTINYEFNWKQKEGPSQIAPVFNCHTPKGQVPGGKKYEIKFEYIPTTHEYIEALWEFSIPSLSIVIPFLLVGQTREPKVNLDRAYLSFRSMLIGSTARDTVYLVNTEDKQYHFTINENSCCSDDRRAKLKVSPMSGSILPNSKLPIEVSFTAVDKREFIFHLTCNVKKKPTPLILNVKADVYAINLSLSATDTDGCETSLPVDRIAVRTIDFGKVPINDRALWKVGIRNNGQFPLHYEWSLSPNCHKKGGAEEKLIRISPANGVVVAHTKSSNELVFSPWNASVLKNCELILQISNGPVLPIALKGCGVEPNVVFNFTEYDFGPRFLHHPNMPPNVTTLAITNKDVKELSIDCNYTNNTPCLDLLFEPKILEPEECMEIDCYFRPQEPIKYLENMVFEINGICKKTVSIGGQGALVKVESLQKVVNLGALIVHEKSSKKVKLVNKSPLAVTFTVNIVPSAQVPALQEVGVLTVSFCPAKGQQLGPDKEITLKPKEIVTVEVSFCPTVRVPQFSEEVIMESHGLSYPLFVVRGSCQGLEISVDSDHVPFGAVVLNSKSCRRVLMMNTGDIGARFNWDVESFAPDFSIFPASGYISPGMEVPFDIIFHPKEMQNDIRYDNLKCHIEGGRPLKITLSGMCIEQTPLKEVLNFSTNVRTKEVKNITIHNKTAVSWLLNPVIDGEYWSGPVSVAVESGHSAQYELTYKPLIMTKDTQKHQGSIFFPLPDGTGLLYNLLGSSDAPKHSGSIVQDIPCKTSHIESVTVQNWLRQPQRFRVIIENIRPERLDKSVTLYGLDYIDVPAMSKREYKIHFYSYKEGSFLFKVIFQNETSGEFQFYHVHFKSVPSGIISTIDLTTPVRQSVSHTITINNPFPIPLNMTTSVNVPDISMPANFLIGAESQGKCTFEYLPLKVDETVGKLILQCNELGSYHYELHLKATPPAPEKPVHFTALLGSTQTLTCHFTSYARGRVEYSCKIDNPDFHVDKSVTVTSVDVSYEPSTLGDTNATLTISSSSGGDYLIPLYGHCLEPKPQGPFSIKAGGSINIPFRNVFHQSTQFSFLLDNPAFSIKASETLKPRKVHNLVVSFDAKQADPSIVKLGKLVVSCKNTSASLRWTYYLKGLALEK